MPSLAELLAGQRMVQQQPSAFDYAGQMMQFQQGMDQFNANRALREMFAQGVPSAQDIYAVSPEFGMKWSQNQMEQAEKMLGMQEKRGQINKLIMEGGLSKEKAYAEATGPAADQYYDDINAGMPQEQALAKFRQGFAAGISRLDAMGMSPDAQIDVTNLNPEQVLGVATGKGYKSRYFEQQQEQRKMEQQHQYRVGEMSYGEELGRGTEQFKRGLPPAPTAEQVYGGVQMTPQGPMAVPPVVQGGVPMAEPSEYAGMEQAPITGDDIDNLRKMYQQLPTGKEKDRMGKMLADAIKPQIRPHAAAPEQAPFQRLAPSGVITPEEGQKMRVEEAKAKETAQAEAKAAVEQKEVKRQKAEVLASLPTVPELNKLIDKSMSGRIEAGLKGTALGEVAGISTEALGATKELEIVAAQMKQITKSLIGAGAVSDFEQRQMAEAAGNIADPRTPADVRKRQLAMFNRIIRKSLMKSPELAQTLGDDDAIDSEQEEAPSVKRGTKPKIGQVESGYMFKGGDPADPNNWEKQ